MMRIERDVPDKFQEIRIVITNPREVEFFHNLFNHTQICNLAFKYGIDGDQIRTALDPTKGTYESFYNDRFNLMKAVCNGK
jgi:hypothetical protein